MVVGRQQPPTRGWQLGINPKRKHAGPIHNTFHHAGTGASHPLCSTSPCSLFSACSTCLSALSARRLPGGATGDSSAAADIKSGSKLCHGYRNRNGGSRWRRLSPPVALGNSGHPAGQKDLPWLQAMLRKAMRAVVKNKQKPHAPFKYKQVVQHCRQALHTGEAVGAYQRHIEARNVGDEQRHLRRARRHWEGSTLSGGAAPGQRVGRNRTGSTCHSPDQVPWPTMPWHDMPCRARHATLQHDMSRARSAHVAELSRTQHAMHEVSLCMPPVTQPSKDQPPKHPSAKSAPLLTCSATRSDGSPSREPMAVARMYAFSSSAVHDAVHG